MKFVSPRNDVAFKKIFGNENRKGILISFLNAVLDLQGDREIVDLDILNPYQAPRVAEGVDAATVARLTGLSKAAVATMFA